MSRRKRIYSEFKAGNRHPKAETEARILVCPYCERRPDVCREVAPRTKLLCTRKLGHRPPHVACSRDEGFEEHQIQSWWPRD